MTLIGYWTCSHDGCLKHSSPTLEAAVGHACCGRCTEGEACKQTVWGHVSPPHPFSPGLLFPDTCSICKGDPH